jgi:hypothetical protein
MGWIQSTLSRPAFVAGDVTWSWEDVALFALLARRWDALEREAAEGLAALRHQEETGEGPTDEAVDQAAADFRYERELITAEEAEGWLEARGLEIADWLGSIRRAVGRQALGDRLDELVRRYPPDPEDVTREAVVDLVCSARGFGLARALAERVAIGLASADGAAPASAPDGAVPLALATLPGLDPEQVAARLGRLADADRAYARFVAGVATPELIRRELDARRMDWIRYDCQVLRLDSEAHAREAALCVREDGDLLEEVAAAVRAPLTELSAYTRDLDPDVRPLFLAATPRELIGPLRQSGMFELYLVREKRLPSEDDPALVERIREAAAERAVADELDRRVRWQNG